MIANHAPENSGAHSEVLRRNDKRVDSGLEQLVYVRQTVTSSYARGTNLANNPTEYR